MSFQNLAFACACECAPCTQYLSRTTHRNWIGANFPLHDEAGRQIKNLWFKRYWQIDTSPQAGKFRHTWSIDGDTYGSFATDDGTGGPSFSLSNKPTLPRMLASRFSAPGRYRIEYALNPQNIMEAMPVSFDPADGYEITMHLDMTKLTPPQDIVYDILYEQWLSPAEMESVLRADLDNPVSSFLTPIPGTNTLYQAPKFSAAQLPIAYPFGLIDAAAVVGGYYEECEANTLHVPAVAALVIVSAHAFKHIDADSMAGFFTGVNIPTLKRTTVFAPGNHSIRDAGFSYTAYQQGLSGFSAPNACTDIQVGSSYTIDAPSENSRGRFLRLNQPC